MKTTVLEPTLEAYEAVQERMARSSPLGLNAIVIPSPIPIPLPILSGSRFLVWKQDPSVGNPGLRITYVPGFVLNGPRDNRVTINLPGTTPVSKNVHGDFIFPVHSPELDCAHTFAVIRDTITMYQRIRGGALIPWAWNTGGNAEPITAYPRAGVTDNAYCLESQSGTLE